MRNLNIKFLCLIILLFSLKISAQNSYINQYKPLATELSKEFGIPSAVILSIAYVETGGGNSKHAQTLNNHFGMVGKNTVNSSRFKSYESSKESFRAFCEMISRKKYYQKLKGNLDYSEWLNAIASAGYAAKPMEWKQKINMVIKKFSL
jgi:Bax protein